MVHIGALEDVAPLLRKLRRKTGKSARTISELAGVDVNSLHAWENALYAPKLEGLLRVLVIYGETVTFGKDPS